MVNGACVCKNISISTSGEPSKVVVCYCTDCRKMSGHLGQIIGVYDTKDVKIDDPNGKLKTYTISNTASGKPNYVNFCQDCACVFTTLPMVYEGNVTMVRTPVLDEGYEKLEPTEEIFTQDRCSFYERMIKL